MMEKEKLKKLLIHQRQACRSAFKLLVTSQVENILIFIVICSICY